MSSKRPLDSRRLKDVKPRDRTEDNSPSAGKVRLERARIVAIVGEKEADQFFKNLDAFRKQWDTERGPP